VKLEVEKVRKAAADVFAARDELTADQTPQAFVDAQTGLVGLSITEAMASVSNGYATFLGRFEGELDYLGNTLTAAAYAVETTDEDAKKSFDGLDIPA
jgi:hypothetical protein